MNFASQVRNYCIGCKYARDAGCLNADKRRGIIIRGWDCGVSVLSSDEGTIFFYQDIASCPKWKLEK